MLKLSDPVAAIPKIGPKYKTLLAKLGIFTVESLLYHFPFRYDDFSEVKKIKDVQAGDLATVQGVLGPIKNIYTRYRKRLTEAVVEDDSGSLKLIWFNSHYLKKTLKPGQKYNFSGKVNKHGSKLSMIAPSYELAGEKTINTGRLVPIYPETGGLSSKWIRTKVKEVFDKEIPLEEFLPEEILKIEHFPEFDQALHSFHFPDSLMEASKAKKRFQLEEFFVELMKVEKRKQAWSVKMKANKITNNKKHQEKLDKLIEKLPFRLTQSQKEALEDILNDLQDESPMNRLLEGDVGTGKTIVAVIASYLTFLNGQNVLYMAPTEILSKQHFETYKNLLEPLGVEIAQLTSATAKKPTKQPYIIVGTHALLYKEKYQNVGLIVIDEQHRFGVEQRAKLVEMNKGNETPHLLTMTATPIPRTLALTIYGDLEISQLMPIPEKHKVVNTKVIAEKNREEAFEWVKKKGEQTFIVCPFIEESSHENFENVKAATAEFEKLQKGVFKGLKMGLLHGKLTSKQKREVVERFENGEIRVLVSTPVIEVGIDIPEAVVMVIESGDRYGLASLHQLRGRVGRGEKPGFCFVFVGSNNRTAYKRLKYLEEINNGLELAEIDMEMRGHGDMYGIMQHGFKRFKVARLSDIETLEKAKKYAQKYFPEIDNHPQLLDKIYRVAGRYVGSN